MSEKTTFGQLLKRFREEKELTQQEVADRAGLKQAEIARFEADRQNPAWVTVHKIAKALGMTCDNFEPAAETEAAKPRKTRKKLVKAKKKKG